MLTEQQARKYKKSASWHFPHTRKDVFCVNNKEAWFFAKRRRKHYSKLINQIKSKGKHK